MASSKDPGFPKLLECWRSIDHHVISRLKKPATDLPYQDGTCLTMSDIETMKISFDPIADTGFWKPPGPDVGLTVKRNLRRFEDVRDRREFFKAELARQDRQTIIYAYSASSEYTHVLLCNIHYCLLRIMDASGGYLFQELWSPGRTTYICLENRFVLSSPDHPHVTIVTIQPQRASSQKELLYSEFWTLLFWARKLAKRGRHTTQRCLPMRLVSICGFEARIVSAVLSYNYPHCVAGKEVAVQVHIGEYRDLSDMKNIHELVMELAATPCGNENVQPESPAKKDMVVSPKVGSYKR